MFNMLKNLRKKYRFIKTIVLIVLLLTMCARYVNTKIHTLIKMKIVA